jgi:diguanylate cyclase (GGDEF)-like protein
MVRETDLVGRYGGEEFLLILEAANETFAFKIAEKIRLEVENYAFPENIRVTVSIGVSTYTEGKTVNELVDQADKSLYEAKRRGRNRTVSLNNGDIITITNFIEKLPE